MAKAKRTEDTRSAVIKLLDLVWGQTNSAVSHSWERLNHSMRAALELTVGAGFSFHEDDMKAIATSQPYRFGYWSGESSEWIYALAVGVENTSAIASYEKWQGRKAFIMDDVRFQTNERYTHGGRMNRQKCRLVVGAEFDWKGQRVTVTSFAADQSYVTACSYKPREKGEYANKIDKRFKITRDDILADRADRKERKELLAKLTEAGEKGQNWTEITEALGSPTKDEFSVMAIAKIKKVLEKFAA